MTCENIQNQCEQNIVREYRLHRELIRPKTKASTFVLLVLGIETASFVTDYILHNLFHWFGMTMSFGAWHVLISMIFLLIFSKKICIMAVELYQHYASDETRRRCTMMPSCSEYALLALQKYNVFKGVYKTCIRLTTKCNGSYAIDYP